MQGVGCHWCHLMYKGGAHRRDPNDAHLADGDRGYAAAAAEEAKGQGKDKSGKSKDMHLGKGKGGKDKSGKSKDMHLERLPQWVLLRRSSSPGPPHDESEEEELNTLDPILEEESESESTRPEERDMALIKYRPPSKTRTD